MSHRPHSRAGKLSAVGTGDGERVECDGVLDLLDQYCTSVNDGRTPHRAILAYLARAFEQVLSSNATMDEAFRLKRVNAGPKVRRPPVQ